MSKPAIAILGASMIAACGRVDDSPPEPLDAVSIIDSTTEIDSTVVDSEVVDSSSSDSAPTDEGVLFETTPGTDLEAATCDPDSAVGDVVTVDVADSGTPDVLGGTVDGATVTSVAGWSVVPPPWVGAPSFVADPYPCGIPASETGLVTHLGATDGGSVEAIGERVFVADSTDWVLWARSTTKQLAIGQHSGKLTAAGGSTFVVSQSCGIEVRELSTGALRTTIVASPAKYDRWGLSREGDYVWATSGVGVSFWSTADGALLASHAGNYVGAVVQANSAAFHSARVGSVESIDPRTGIAALWPTVLGAPRAWFGDGTALITKDSSSLHVFRSGKELLTLPAIEVDGGPDGGRVVRAGGYGNFLWMELTSSGMGLALYDLRLGATPVRELASASGFVASPSSLAWQKPSIGIISNVIETLDLAKEPLTIVERPYVMSWATEKWTALSANGDAFALMHSSGRVHLGDSSSRRLGCGGVWSTSSSDDGLIATATFRGVVITKTRDATSLANVGYLPTDFYASATLAASGKVAAVLIDKSAAGVFEKPRLYLYDVPSFSIRLVLDGRGTVGAFPIKFSADGSRALIGSNGSGSCGTIDTKTGAVLQAWPFCGYETAISPGGSRVALVSVSGDTMIVSADGSASPPLQVTPLGWLSDDRLLVASPWPNPLDVSTPPLLVLDASGTVVDMPNFAPREVVYTERPVPPRSLPNGHMFAYGRVFDPKASTIPNTIARGFGVTSTKLVSQVGPRILEQLIP